MSQNTILSESNFFFNHEKVLNKIKKYKNTHPNLTTFWCNLLNLKKTNYLNHCKNIENNLNNLKCISDPTNEQLLLLICFNLSNNK